MHYKMYVYLFSIVHDLMTESSQLQSQIPALFNKDNIEERLFFAMRAMLIYHTYCRKLRANRFRRSKRNQENAKPSLAERMAANLASIIDGTQAPRIFASPAPTPRKKVQPSSSGLVKIRSPLSEIPVSASGSLSARQQHSPTLSPQTPDSNANAKTPSISISSGPKARDFPSSLARHGSSHVDDSKIVKVESRSFPIPSTSSSNMIVSPTSCGNTQVRGSQIRSVQKFLEAARPPMTHLLQQFIEFGCRNEDFLLAVSVWPLERIRKFLKSLPPGPGGSPLTKMEVDILTYHFESYFLVSNSKA